MKKIAVFLITLFIFIPVTFAKELNIYLFHSDTCPHCASEREFLDTLDNVNVRYYEVNSYPSLTVKVREKLKIKESVVPITVIGSDYIIGYNDNTKEEILDMIKSYSKKEHCDSIDYIINDKDLKKCNSINKGIYKSSTTKTISVLGKKIKFDAKSVSLPLISMIIGFVDGFNPCAMWVLIFLISMLFNMKSKKKMLILGITFLVTSALVYLIFMLGLLKIANSLIGSYFKYVIAFIALIGGIINLYSYLKSLKNNVGCEVTSKDQKKKTINKIKNIVNEKNFIIALIGIILLAISVNFVELACSAGLPTMFIGILSLNQVNLLTYIICIALYILMFMIDDIVIFVLAVTTLKINGISNKYTKYSHLIGGIIMLIIGILMIFKTDWLMFNF